MRQPISPSFIHRTSLKGDSPREIALAVASSLLFPPVLLYAALRATSFRQRQWLLTLLVAYYGITLPIAYDPSGMGADGVRHLLSVYNIYLNMSFGEFLNDLWDIFMLRGSPGSNDPYKHVLSYFVGGVLGIPELFFPIVAIIYGYFFTGSMLIIFERLGNRKLPWVIIFLATTFFLTRNIEALQAVRNPTAIWVLIYGVLRFHQSRRIRYLVLMGTTPLIHFGFFLIAVPAFLFLILGNRPILISVLFVLSSGTNFIPQEQVIDSISMFELGEKKLGGYRAEERTTIEMRDLQFEQTGAEGIRFWRAYMLAGYQILAFNLLVYAIILSQIYLLSMNRFQKSIFSTGLLTLTAANSLWFLGGASGRVWEVGFLLSMAGFLVWRLSPGFDYKAIKFSTLYKSGVYLSAIGLIPYFLFHLSVFIERLNIYFFFFPLGHLLFPESSLTVKDAFRYFVGLI